MNISECLNCGKEVRYKPSQQTGKYCDNSCQQQYQHKEKVRKWLEEGVEPGVKTLRRHLTEQRNGCYTCGITHWLNNPITLELDHFDGNHQNNQPDNLRMLCPNCHAQTPTYRNKNRGNGRASRRKCP